MQPLIAVVEEAEVYKISDIFHKNPLGLGFNETDTPVTKARMQDGRQVGATFYFCLKPNRTFEEEALGRDAFKAGRHKLASFLRYYGLAGEIDKYILRERVHEFKGSNAEVIPNSGRALYLYSLGDHA